MKHGWPVWVAVAVAAGCGDDAGPVPYEPPPEGCVVAQWDPEDGEITRWPEPDLLVDDPDTGTGWRLHVDPVRYAATVEAAERFQNIFTEELSDLDGFGVNSQAFFRFSAPLDPALVPSDEGSAVPSPDLGLGLLVLRPGEPRLMPFLLRTTDEDATAMMVPMRPLPEQATVVAFATKALDAAAGGCVWPSEAYHRRIHGDDPDVSQAIEVLASWGVIADAHDLVALSPFPTQTITDDSVAIADDIAGRSFDLDGDVVCVEEPEREWRACEGAFLAADYRGPDAVIRRLPGDPVVPSGTYRIPFTAWLPLEGVGSPPYETLVFGHGLGGDRYQARRLAEFAAPLGMATVAIDAVQHGEHPTVPEEAETDTLATVLRFFAADLDSSDTLISALVLRDHWRQSTYDKLQLTRLLRDGVDLDGDAAPDLDPARLAYLGVSLGGIMGSELAALTDAYEAVLLVVPGGRVSSIVSESETFGPLVGLLAPGRPPGDIQRFFPVLQTILDRGDSASYGPHVLGDRLTGSAVPPSVLLGVVLDDDTVPNVSNYALARAIDVPVVPPVLRPYPGMVTGDTPPVAGNVAGGAATAGLLQFDTVGDGMGGVELATHSNVGDSDVGSRAWLEFLMGHWDDGMALIVDPYELEGVEHLEVASP
ncbi:MAG: hypothetical protein ACODAU_03490 [Myxococcota bacterium]